MNKSLFWVALSAAFSVFIGYEYGIVDCIKYIACYGAELSLSLDNLLMFYVIFKYFKLDKEKQKHYLTIGIWSALFLRAIVVVSGSYLLQKFSWLSYVFAAFLLYSGIPIIFDKQNEDKEPKALIDFVNKYFPWLSITALIIGVIEITDLMFAMDSIPVSLGITKNPLIVFAANAFAIMGLRSMYFLMLDMIERFVYIEKIVAVILIATGIKFIIWG